MSVTVERKELDVQISVYLSAEWQRSLP